MKSIIKKLEPDKNELYKRNTTHDLDDSYQFLISL